MNCTPLAFIFSVLGHKVTDWIVKTVIWAALDWDVPPSDIENCINTYIEKEYRKRKK